MAPYNCEPGAMRVSLFMAGKRHQMVMSSSHHETFFLKFPPSSEKALTYGQTNI